MELEGTEAMSKPSKLSKTNCTGHVKNISFIFNSHDKFDRQIEVSTQISQIESWKSVVVVLGSDKEFVITKAQTHDPEHSTAYQWSEPSEIQLTYPGAH